MQYELRLSSPSLDVLPLVAIADAVARTAAAGGDTPFHKPTYKGKFRKLRDWVVDDARAGRLAVTDQDGRPGTFDEVVQRAKNDGTYSEVFELSEETRQRIADGEPFNDALQDPASTKFDLNATHALCVCTTLKNLNDWASAQGNTFSISRVGWIDERGWIEPHDAATENPLTTDTRLTVSGRGQHQIKPVYSGTGNTSVVFLINGREAIPVRAIPLVAPVPYGVRYLVQGLMCCDRSNAMHGLTAYQRSPGAKQPLAVPPTQWMQVDSRLRALKASLERQESTELLSREEGEDRYNRESISILPAGVFVWKDDFVDARTRKLRRVPEHEIVALEDSSRDHIKFLQQQVELPANDPAVDQWEYSLGENWREQLAAYIAEERAIDPIPPELIAWYDRICCGQAPLTDVSFSPLVEPDLRKQMMEGFEHLVPVETPDRTFVVDRCESGCSVPNTLTTEVQMAASNSTDGGEIPRMLAKWFEKPIGELPPRPRAIAGAYTLGWPELSAADRRARADEADHQVQATLGHRFEKARMDAEQANAATPARFAQHAMQDGFDEATREKAGERNLEAKVSAVNLSDNRCTELAHSHELRIADWTKLTGIG